MERLNASRLKESIQEDSEDDSEEGGSIQFSVSSDGGKRSPLIIGQIKGNVPVLSDDERSQASMDERVMGELHHGSLSSDEEASIESI